MKNRVAWLDTVRMVAIFCVVLNHSVEIFYDGNVIMNSFDTWFAVTLFSFGRLGVPMFLFLSGYLLLSKSYEMERDYFKFWKDKLLPLFISWEIWTIIYWVFFCLHFDKPMVFAELLEQMLMVRKSGLSHTWYIYMLLGMYPFYPFIATALQKCSERVLLVLLTFVSVWTMWLPLLNDFAKILKIDVTYNGQLTLGFAGGVYGIMLALGYLLTHKEFFQLKKWQDILGFLVCFCFIIIIQVIKYHNGLNYRVWYTFPLLPLAALFLTDWLRKLNLENLQHVCYLISKYAFGIYLLHKPIQMLLRDTGLFFLMPMNISVIVMFFSSFLLSFCGVWGISKINCLGELLFLIKSDKKRKTPQ